MYLEKGDGTSSFSATHNVVFYSSKGDQYDDSPIVMQCIGSEGLLYI